MLTNTLYQQCASSYKSQEARIIMSLKATSIKDEVSPKIIEIFKASRNNYGTRKIKVELKKLGYIVSRRKIGRIMKQNGLVSNYTVAQYKPHVAKCNEDKIANELKYQTTICSSSK